MKMLVHCLVRYLAVCVPGVWLHIGMSCNSSNTYSRLWAIPQQWMAQCQHPEAPLALASVMGDNVISWLEYSLHEMSFSYSLTHVIIFWLIVSIERTHVHPSTFIAILHIFADSVIFPPQSLFPFPLIPSFFSINSHASEWYSLNFPAPCVCIPLLLLVISFLNSLSGFFSSHTPFQAPLFSPLCPRESHISIERN